MRELTFYFDYVSNNAYLAWTQLSKLMEEHQINFKPVPVLFAGLLNSHGNVGPAELPAKRNWMLQNIMRKCALLNVPMNPPLHHPFDPLLALRAASVSMSDTQRWQLIDKIFEAVWVRQLHVSEPEVVAQLAREAGLDGDAIVASAQQSEAKLALREQTETAIAEGVFGIPSMVWQRQLFFGYDDFEFLSMALKGEDPLDMEEVARWSMDSMNASSHRRSHRDKLQKGSS